MIIDKSFPLAFATIGFAYLVFSKQMVKLHIWINEKNPSPFGKTFTDWWGKVFMYDQGSLRIFGAVSLLIAFVLFKFNATEKTVNDKPASNLNNSSAAINLDNYKDSVLKLKSLSKWGGNCGECNGSPNTFEVFYQNTAQISLDIMIGVKEDGGGWRLTRFMGTAPNDTIHAYVCNGDGHSLVLARKSNDAAYIFPSQEEIDKTYKFP